LGDSHGKTIVRDGVSLNVLDEGEGRPVLLMHGFPDSNYLWRKQIPALVEAGYRVIAPDHRGFGLSDKPAGVDNYLIKEIVADTLAILDALQLDQVALIAHDWGAGISWHLVDEAPERFTCFVPMSVGAPQNYFSCSDIRQKEMSWYTLFFQAEAIPEMALSANDWQLFRQWTRYHSETEHYIADLSRDGALTAGINWYRANLAILAQSHLVSRIPTLGLWSDGDDYVVEEQMVASGRYVESDWRYERIEDASHWMMLDRPEHINRLLLNFLTQYHPPTH